MTTYRIIKPMPFPAAMTYERGKFYWADSGREVDWEALEKAGYIETIEEPDPNVALGEAWDSGWESAAHCYWRKPRNPYTGEMNDDDPDDYCPGHGGTSTVEDCYLGPEGCS